MKTDAEYEERAISDVYDVAVLLKRIDALTEALGVHRHSVSFWECVAPSCLKARAAVGGSPYGPSQTSRRGGRPMTPRVKLVNVARVWCGVMPRVGSKNHMYLCQDCRKAKRRYWQAIRAQTE